MNDESIIIPIGLPLGIWQGRGRIQNGNRLLETDPKTYTLWFYGHLTMDVGGWVSLCMEKNILPDERECLSSLRELEEAGLWILLKKGEPEAFMEAARNCAAVRQGIYYREDADYLIFAIGYEHLKIPNVPLIRQVWMGADGHAFLPDLIRRHDHEGIAGNRETLEQALIVLLKNRLILLEAVPEENPPGA